MNLSCHVNLFQKLDVGRSDLVADVQELNSLVLEVCYVHERWVHADITITVEDCNHCVLDVGRFSLFHLLHIQALI